MENIIIKAARFAHAAHTGQRRKYTNRPYIEHPTRVACRVVLRDWATAENVAAAWLHDVVEDCPVSFAQVEVEFGEEVMKYVWWLTNPSKIVGGTRAARKKIDRDHLKQSPVCIQSIKLIDRIDNLREMLSAKEISESGLSMIGEGMSKGFRELYGRESIALVDALTAADPDLREECLCLAKTLI
jgi:(p)ppGpp synthase/HD superfamily hydrolase